MFDVYLVLVGEIIDFLTVVGLFFLQTPPELSDGCQMVLNTNPGLVLYQCSITLSLHLKIHVYQNVRSSDYPTLDSYPDKAPRACNTSLPTVRSDGFGA